MTASTNRGRLLVAATLVLLLAGSSIALGPAAAAPSGIPSAESLSAPIRVPQRDAAVPARLDARLSSLASAAAYAPADAKRLSALAESAGVRSADGKVAVVVQPDGPVSSAEKAVAAAGGEVAASSAGVVLARVAPSRLLALAGAPGVLRVRPPLRMRTLATGGTEGVRITGADAAQASGVDGTNVRIGIIDAGFYGYRQLETDGWLPAASQVATALFDVGKTGITFERDASGWPSEHGSAVAEIAHETAPGAKLYLATVGSEFDIASAVSWMHANGVRVVNMSLGWIGWPLDGGATTGSGDVVNPAVDTAVRTDGMFWANASGNFRLNHWKGDFVDRDGDFGADWTTKTNLNTFFYDPAQDPTPIEGILWWRDSWTNAVNDYDLMLFKYNETLQQWQSVNLGGQGEAVQARRTGDQPYEDVYWANAGRGWYAWAIVNMRPWATSTLPANNTKVDFDFFCPNQELNVRVAARSIMTPADNESNGFMAVGAISAKWEQNPYVKFSAIGDPGFGQEELYSSEGPNQHGALSPEISAPDNVTNHVFSQFYSVPFRGTSASSPHVAGVAALALQRNAALTASGLESYIRGSALGLWSAGPDNQTGYGEARVPPVQALTVEATRVAGSDRYRTSLAVSKSWPNGSATDVVVASGATFPDALAGASLAGGFGCPVLLTQPAGTLPELRAELHRLGATTVHLLGSEAAVSPTAVQQLEADGFTVERHFGSDRYATAAAVASASLDLRPSDTAFVANGATFADPLAAAPIAYSQGFPVLLTRQGSLPAATAAVLRDGGIKHVFIIGDTKAVSSAVGDAIIALGITVGRAGGATRYDTATEVADLANGQGWATFQRFGIASGTNFPDALTGAADIGRGKGVILLTPPKILASQAASVLRTYYDGTLSVRVYGGEPTLHGAVLLGAKDIADR